MFARWQALFANFDFEVKHIIGKNNCLPNFLRREYLNQKDTTMVIVIEWEPSQHIETLRSISETQNWEEYYSKWKQTLQLRNTKVLHANLQPH